MKNHAFPDFFSEALKKLTARANIMNGGVRITGTCRDRPKFEKRGTDLNIKKIGLTPIIKV